MEEQSSSQRRQQILAGAGILGDLAGGLALKLLGGRTRNLRSDAAPATNSNVAPPGNNTPLTRPAPTSFAAQPDPYLSAQAAFLDAQLTQVEEALAVAQEETLAAVGAAPKRPSLPLPHYSEQPTQGPPLTRQISDALTIGFTFFCRGLLINDAHYLADKATKDYIWRFLDSFWDMLDENTRNWVVRTPALWVELQRTWRTLTPLQQKATIDYYKEWFEWFGEQSDAWAKRQALGPA
jgi:hypothetical protein